MSVALVLARQPLSAACSRKESRGTAPAIAPFPGTAAMAHVSGQSPFPPPAASRQINGSQGAPGAPNRVSLSLM